MSVLDRAALEDSPLADLHAIASELSIDSYRRLRRAELIEAILERQGGERAGGSGSDGGTEPEGEPDGDDREGSGRRRRGRRGGRGRSGEAEATSTETADPGRPATREPEPEPEDEVVEGVVELLANGSGFVRVSPPEPSEDDVYISAAQVKRCELVSGDRVSGPRRRPRRSERFASMVRIDTINDRPADELAEGARFDELPATFADQRFRLGSEDATIKAIEWLAPFGRGSRVTICGAARAGKSEAMRRLAAALVQQSDIQCFVVLCGVRPEEIGEWSEDLPAPAVTLSFGVSADVQGQAAERVVDQARRLAARGSDVVVMIDTLDGLHPQQAQKLTAAARNLRDGGSLTIVSTSARPVGGESTVIALDSMLAATGRFPAIDLAASGVLKPERLVGDAGAQAIARAREEALAQ